MKSALVIIFRNFEETEAIAPIDILKRAGADVKIATMSENLETSGRSGIQVRADVLFSRVKDAIFDAVIVSGGPGTANVAEDPALLDFIKRHDALGKIVAAICAAPAVLKNAGVLEGKTCVCHTSKEKELEKYLEKSQNKVAVCKNAITSRGAGTAIDFGLALAAALCGESAAQNVANSICF